MRHAMYTYGAAINFCVLYYFSFKLQACDLCFFLFIIIKIKIKVYMKFCNQVYRFI